MAPTSHDSPPRSQRSSVRQLIVGIAFVLIAFGAAAAAHPLILSLSPTTPADIASLTEGHGSPQPVEPGIDLADRYQKRGLLLLAVGHAVADAHQFPLATR